MSATLWALVDDAAEEAQTHVTHLRVVCFPPLMVVRSRRESLQQRVSRRIMAQFARPSARTDDAPSEAVGCLTYSDD